VCGCVCVCGCLCVCVCVCVCGVYVCVCVCKCVLYYCHQLVSLQFFVDIKSFRSHYGPGVNSASNRNEDQDHFLGVKAAGA